MVVLANFLSVNSPTTVDFKRQTNSRPEMTEQRVRKGHASWLHGPLRTNSGPPLRVFPQTWVWGASLTGFDAGREGNLWFGRKGCSRPLHSTREREPQRPSLKYW